MPLLWLRVALVFYGVGLVYALLALARKGEPLARVIMPAFGLGLTFHFVSLAELTVEQGHLSPSTQNHAESLLAFLVGALFLVFWIKYRTVSPGIFVFPLVFLLTMVAAIGQQSQEFTSPLLRRGWIFVHVTLIFLGYAALFLSFVASMLYLVQERRLKSKKIGKWLRLPPLEVIDEIGYRALLLGFPFITLGLIAGAIVAQEQFGAGFFRDPKIALSIMVWVIYMVLLFTRWSAGWRGRKAAFLSTFAFVAAIGTWAANYLSGTHRFLGP